MRKSIKYMGYMLLLMGLVCGNVSGANAAEYEENLEGQEITEEPEENPEEDPEEDPEEEWEDEKISFSRCECSLVKNVYSYTGAKITPKVSVTGPKLEEHTVTQEKTALKEGTDYTVTYEKNKNYGVGRVIIQGIGNYTGYHLEKFGIVPGKVRGGKGKKSVLYGKYRDMAEVKRGRWILYLPKGTGWGV